MNLFRSIVVRILSTFLLMCAISAFASQKSAFEHAQSLDTIAAFQDFLSQYPKSTFAPQAHARLMELQEVEFTKDFDSAKRVDTIKSWDEFLIKGSGISDNKPQIQEAKDRRDTLLLAQCDSEKSRPKLEDFLKNHGDSHFAPQVRTRLDARHTNTVPSTGEVLWASTTQVDKASAAYVLDISCSWKEGEIKAKVPPASQNGLLNQLMGGDASFGQLFAADTSAIPNQNLDFPTAYPLRFAQPTDRVMIWKSPSFGDKLLVLEGSPDIHESAGQGSSANVTLFLNVQVTKDPSTLYVSGGQFASKVATEGNVVSMHSGSSTVDSGVGLVEGKISLPRDEWVTVKRGIDARGGEIVFETNRVLLSPGTSVIRYPDVSAK